MMSCVLYSTRRSFYGFGQGIKSVKKNPAKKKLLVVSLNRYKGKIISE
jgi:hypothetical protein